MLKVDLERFWAEDEIAHLNNCFNPKATQVALGIRMSDECVFAELGVPGDPWGFTGREERMRLNKLYNDRAEKIVGKRLLSEQYPIDDMMFPYVKRIGEVFGGRYEHHKNTGEWLYSGIDTEQALEELLDKVDRLNLREFMLPTNWESEKTRLLDTYGLRPKQMRHIRGPVTLAMSIYGSENLIFLGYDNPELFARFSNTIRRVVIEMAEIMDAESAQPKGETPHGFSFADDNCSLLTPDLYEVFGYSVLKAVFEKFSPNAEDIRFQHSDSEMSHLLPILGKLNLTGCNFGPTVLVEAIRKHMPNTRIDGCLAPFTFMTNNQEKIMSEVRRDCDAIRRTSTMGLNLTTAGSINNGSSLESMRTVMHVIQNYCR